MKEKIRHTTFQPVTEKDIMDLLEEAFVKTPPKSNLACGAGAILSLSDDQFMTLWPFSGITIYCNAEQSKQIEDRARALKDKSIK